MNGVPGLTPPRILLLGTGGTIAMASDAGGAIKPALQADELVRAVPALERIAALETVAYSNKPGATLTLRDLASLSDVIADGFDRGCQGAVVVQGTDTIEETAFALELLARSTLPVVVTGAMRGAQAPGADGPSNLLAAVTVAASPDAAGLGTLVVLGDEAHAARHVQKTHTTLPSAFRSPGAGPLGTIQEGQFRLFGWQAPLPALRVAAARLDETPVALLRIGLDDDGRTLRALPQLGYQGAVIEAMGAGHVPAWLAPDIGELAARMPVVLSTRVAAGPVLRITYGFPDPRATCCRAAPSTAAAWADSRPGCCCACCWRRAIRAPRCAPSLPAAAWPTPERGHVIHINAHTGVPQMQKRHAALGMFAVLLFSYVINAIDRQLFSVLAADVRNALDLSLPQVGWRPRSSRWAWAWRAFRPATCWARCRASRSRWSAW